MGLALSLLRLALALVFFLAAGGKMVQRRYVGALSERFALPPLLAPAVVLLPGVEAAVGALLLFTATAGFGAWACTGLLLAFSALLVRNRISGRQLACGCFGERSGSFADRWPLWRNAALLVMALFVALAHPRPALWSEAVRVGPWGTAVLVLAVVSALAVSTAPLHWSKGHGRPAVRSFALTTFDGEPTTLGDLLEVTAPTFVLFLAPGCGACRSLLAPLRDHRPGPRSPRLIVAAPPSAAADEEIMNAVAGASAAVVDDGRLAALFDVAGTPSVVELGTDGRHVRTVVGAREVGALLGWRESSQPAHSGGGTVVLSRRRAIRLGFGSVAAPMLGLRHMSGLLPAALGGSTSRGGVQCPSCGSCSVCTYDASSRKLTCRPCQQACSGKKLCASYANQLAGFRSLSAWLTERGFHQSSDPFTLGMQQGGKLTALSSLTPFHGASAATPKALLVYDLTNSGERAWAALLDGRGRFVEVAGVSSGQVVSSAVPHLPAANGSQAATGAPHAVTARAASDVVPATTPGYDCADLCGFALGVGIALATLPASVLAAPEWVAAGFAASLFSSGLGLMGASGASTATGALAPLVLSPLELGGTLVNGIVDGATSFGSGLAQSALCNELCKLETKYCCNYGCGCFKDYHACLSACPLDLKHPMAACNTYRRLGPGTNWVQVTGIPSKCKV